MRDSDLLHQQSFVHGEWVESRSGERFDVLGMAAHDYDQVSFINKTLDPGTGVIWASCPNNCVQDVNPAVESSHKAFQDYRIVSPRTRAKLLLKWNDLITAARDDLATMLTYETGKPLAEAYGELDYALGFTWWFAGEAERIHGSIAVPAAPGRRVFTVKQAIGVAVALVPW